MAVNMSGAIIPKDISICLVVQEIARQIDHFTFGLIPVNGDLRGAITQQPERQFTSGLVCVKAKE